MWLTDFKIAIIEKNVTSLNKLMDTLPELEDKKDIEEAIYLLKEATAFVNSLKNETSESMVQIKKNLQFLRSTDAPAAYKLDVRL